jgi:hypothetical protein
MSSSPAAFWSHFNEHSSEEEHVASLLHNAQQQEGVEEFPLLSAILIRINEDASTAAAEREKTAPPFVAGTELALEISIDR